MLWDTREATIHVHHVFIGWALALFAEFNHPASAVFLAVMSALFVQGAPPPVASMNSADVQRATVG